MTAIEITRINVLEFGVVTLACSACGATRSYPIASKCEMDLPKCHACGFDFPVELRSVMYHLRGLIETAAKAKGIVDIEIDMPR